MSEQDKYRRIAAELREGIRTGRYPVGTMLPSRSSLVTQYAVAVVTARHALAMLEAEGLIRIEQGRGTTVISNRIARSDHRMRHDALMAELHALRCAIDKCWDMADRDGYLHPATISPLPDQVFRVMLDARRLWDHRMDEEKT